MTALVLAILAYPVLGTLALWTGFVEWAIRSEDMRVEIANPAYTIWPGRIHAKEVAIFANGETQFILRASDLLANISVLELLKDRVHVTELRGHHVKYHMRVQVKDPKGMEERIKAYPKLEGLPGKNVISEKVAEKSEERDTTWTVVVDGLDASVVDLWFFEYRYVGDGRLRGGFTVGPGVMEVTTAVQDLGPGELRFGEKEPIARQFQGQINCDIPRVNPEQHADASFVELVSARVNLSMDVLSLVNVGAYFDAFDVSKGAGPLKFDLYMEKGLLGPKSKLSYQTDSLRLKGDGFGLQTDWKLDFDAAGEAGLPLGRSDFQSTYVSFAKRDRELTVQIHGHHAEAALDTIRLGSATDLKRAALRMPQIISKDLDDLGVFLGDDSKLKVKAGEAKASVSLDMDGKYWVRGPIKAEVLRTELSASGVEISGNTWLSAEARFNPKLKTNILEDLVVRLRNYSMETGDEDVSDWWMDLSSKRLTLWNGATPRAEAVSASTREISSRRWKRWPRKTSSVTSFPC